MNAFKGEYQLYELGTSEYKEYLEGDIVSYKNKSYSAMKDTKGGQRPDRNPDWQALSGADIIGISITADAGLTGTMWTHNGFHHQDITVATGGITTAHIADNAITSSKIADGAILGVDVAVGVTLTNPDITGDVEVFGNVTITGTAGVINNSLDPILTIKHPTGNRQLAIEASGGISMGSSDVNVRGASGQSGSFARVKSTGLVIGNTGEFTDVVLTKGLSAQDGAVEGYTGDFNNIVAHGGISANGLTLGNLSINFLGLIASATAISSGSILVGAGAATEVGINSGGISAGGNIIKGNTGDFNRVVAHEGISCGGNIELNNSGDISLILNSDSDNSGENDNPLIRFNQDGSAVNADIGMVGDSGQIYTGSIGNAWYINTNTHAAIQFSTNSSVRQTIHTGGMNQFHSGISAEGATFGGGVIIHGGVSAGGISTDNIHVKSGISAGTLVTGNTAEFTSLVGAKGVSAAGATIGGYWAGQHEEIIGIAIDNGLDVITTGKKGHRIIPYDCEVTEWTVTSSDSGSIQFDINWCTYANWTTTASVGGSGLPSISSATKNQDTSVNWTKTTFDAGNIIEFEVDSVTTLTNCVVSLKIRRTG